MIGSEIIRGFIDSIILEILTLGDNYGYEISKEIETRTGGKFIMKEATLYAAFKRLERKGLVESYKGQETHGRQRKYYKISAHGTDYLNEKKVEWAHSKVMIDLFLGED